MKCPICNRNVDSQSLECRECGESLMTWRTLEAAAEQIRDRGLQQAANQDYASALLSFLEAAFANPLEMKCWLDAARAMVHLGQTNDALRILEVIRRRAPQSEAAALIEAIREKQRKPIDVTPPSVAATATATEVPAMTETPVAATPTTEQEPVAAKSVSPIPGESPAAPQEQSERRRLLGLPPMRRKKSLLQRFAGSTADSLWESVLAAEGHANQAEIGGRAWLQLVAQQETPHGAVLYMLGLDCWQTQEHAEAIKWFVKAVQQGSPYLNPVAYFLCCTAIQSRQPDGGLRLLRDCGIHADEIQQVVRELCRHEGQSLSPELVTQLKAMEQMNAAM